MQKYNSQKIEKKWQNKWDKDGIYKAKNFSKKLKYYCLIEFPYPSGAGLHVGHLRSHIAIDIVARQKRMSDHNVLYPIGWDAFGLPTENFAIKTKTHPKIVTKNNIKNFTRQIKSYGPSFDWSREINTTDPNYYKWTQWIFLKLFNSFYDEKLNKAREIKELKIPKDLNALEKKEFIDNYRLAYEKEMAINWCPSCKIGLANEEVINNACERCGAPAEKKIMKQWMLRITKYADRLIRDLDSVDYLDKIRTQQINWIGKSEGATIKFPVITKNASKNVILASKTSKNVILSERSGSKDLAEKNNNPFNEMLRQAQHDNIIETFTTRPDTLFGCTYMVLSPEHSLIENLKDEIENYSEVEKYILQAKNKSDLDRTDLAKEKTGVELKGLKAINPANNEEIPIWVADYVLTSYGTGAIMAVPAHDERDFEFAKKFGLDIKSVIEPAAITVIVQTKEEGKISVQKEKDEFLKGEKAFCDDGILINSEKYSSLTSEKAREKIIHWLSKNNLGEKAVNYKLRDWVFSRQHYWGEPIPIVKCKNCGLKDLKIKNELSFYDQNIWNQIIDDKKTVETRALNPEEKNKYFGNIKVDDLIKINNKKTGKFEIIKVNKVYNFKSLKELFKEKDLVKKIFPETRIRNFQDLEKCYSFTEDYLDKIQKNGLVGWEFEIINITENVALKEKDLPLELPDVKNYEPTDTGESPLANISKWVNVKCPQCGGSAKRETDTMPNWAGSSWYFLRYLDPENKKDFASRKKIDYWMPVDLYNGGMEHTTLHLLYSRFWHKFLFDLGYVNTPEPYKMRRSHGMILAEDGQKMSKSRGNVVNPDEVIKQYGADTIRLYEMFMGPYGDAIPWNTTSLIGMNRFLERIWNMQNKVGTQDVAFNKKRTQNIVFLHKNKTLLIATKNKGKLKELKDHLKNYNIISLDNIDKNIKEPIEDGKTFAENSLIKAKYYAQKTGYLTIADDSGLCVNALDGRPGVNSSRYAEGDYKKAHQKIFKELNNKKDRAAYFQSVVTIYNPENNKYEQFSGKCEGSITEKPHGTGGFGYDPIFMPKGFNKSFGECSNKEKYKFDHRKKAIDKLIEYLNVGTQDFAFKKKRTQNIVFLLHKTIKKVTEDIENLKFNTAISQLMILVNEMDKQEKIQIADYKLLITLLSPFAPHITEEIWEEFKNKESIHLQPWPKYDPSLIIESEITLVVQINGKVRDQIKAPANISEEEAKKLALESEKIKKWIKEKEVRKIIFVKGKLVNVVV